MFIGRERELSYLNEFYEKDGIGMTVLYGRRRIGKSTLISEFVKDKKTIFYTAAKVGKERNLELFSERVADVLLSGAAGIRFQTVEAVFDFIAQNLRAEKIVLVIDELPYWAEKDEALLSILQKYIDTIWRDKNLKIILCGSALSFMESKVLSEKSPLFGRRDSQIKLEAFDYLDSAQFVPEYSYEDKAICYGITGGVAKYLAMIDPAKSIDENIVRLFFRTDGYLYDETRNLLTQEFSDITLVNNIIEQVASGKNTLNTIATGIGEKEPTILYSLEKLISVGLVGKKKCITEEKNKKKTQYVLKDHMFQFWYKFIPKAISVIEVGQGERYYKKVVKPVLHFFMGTVFEDMCRYYTLRHGVLGEFNCFITAVGSWWGTETIAGDHGEKRAQPADIDVVALSETEKKAVVGECKFKNEKLDKGVYETLRQRANLLAAKYEVIKYLLFSLSGYTEWFDTLQDNNVIRLSLEDLYQSAEGLK